MGKITKATRFQIIKPLDASWDELGQVLRDLSYHTTRMCNAAVQLYWEHHNRRLAHKAEHGAYPKDADLYGQSFRNYVYHQLREIYPLMASSNVSQTNQFALNRWRADIKEIMRLQKSIPSFKLGTPVQVANQNYTLRVTEGEAPEFQADVTLLSREAEHSRFSLLLDGGDAPKKAIFRRLANGAYKQGVMQIVRHPRKKKWFCIVSYTFTPEQANNLDPTRTMGVDFACGAENAVYWAFSFNPKRGSIPAGEIEAAEKKIAAITARRKELQRTAGVTGHGRKRKLNATQPMAGKAAHIREAINHKYAKRIVQVAAGNRCGVIRLADMSGAQANGPLGAWPWADLVEKIRYKAEEKGIAVEVVDRGKAYCTCSKCGHSDPENIEGNDEFLVCRNPGCKARINQVYNAAANIAAGV